MNEIESTFQALIGSLPKSITLPFDEEIKKLRVESFDCIIVLDDDPTGTQTVYDIPVLTDWTTSSIKCEIELGSSIFFILTNSRSLPTSKAKELAFEIGRNIKAVTSDLGKKCLIISRGDSTLRGHYPEEVYALQNGLVDQSGVHFFIPTFFEGGRYTIEDIHYVREGEKMIPCAQTPFALDKVFGYSFSNLKKFVLEKARGFEKLNRIHSISVREIREKTTEEISQRINDFNAGDICIINAVDYGDLKKIFISILHSSINPVFRTSASFVSAIAAQPQKTLLTQKDLSLKEGKGGLIIVGSYVAKSTQQLEYLRKTLDIQDIEMDVNQLIEKNSVSPKNIASRIDDFIDKGKNVVLSTSRSLVSTSIDKENLEIGEMVSIYIAKIVEHLKIQPRYILAKGGITSSDIATKSLKVKRAMVKGQIIPGVPVWVLGKECKFPRMHYIIFPGNVGSISALGDVVKQLGTGFIDV